MSAQPKQMQTRAKSIAKRVQTKKPAPTIIAENYKQKIMNSNSQKEHKKNQQNTKKTRRNPGFYCQRLKSKKVRDKNSKTEPQTPNKTRTTHLGRKVHRPENSPKLFI